MITVSENISLKSFNTFGIDVAARYFASFTSIDDLLELVDHPQVKNGNRLVLGGGSNMLLTRNFSGIVLKNELRGIELVGEDDLHYYVKSQAGEIWHSLVMHCIKNGFAGIENLSLIPGCVGASPMQNIGAYGVELKDVFDSLEALQIEDGYIKSFSLEECQFGYRESIFKKNEKNKWIILSVTFKLNKRAILNTSYGAIDAELDKMNLDKVTIKDVSQAVINIRTAKLPDPKKIGNAGSFFKNPVIPIQLYDQIKKAFANAPCYPINENEVKIPAGWLIEQAGWKGKNLGNYGVHANQALVLVNYGNATGKEIYDLSTSIIEDVNFKFGVELEREVNII
jgi:UDP-N-acetylmuramate dehydrogenase